MKHRKTCFLPASLSPYSSAPPSPTSPSVSNGTSLAGFLRPGASSSFLREPMAAEPEFAELLARSNFSFLQGASHPEELVVRARILGYKGLALCDVNGLYGVVRGYQAAERPSLFDAEQLVLSHDAEAANASFHYMSGVELTPHDASPVVLLPLNKNGHIGICRLLTLAKRRAPKGHMALSLAEILDKNDDLLVFPLPPWKEEHLKKLQDAFQDRIYLPVCKDLTWESLRHYQHALNLEEELGLTLFATNRPLFHEPSRRPLHDVLTCILHKTTLEDASTRLVLNRERYLKSRKQIGELFRDRLDLLANTIEIAKRVEFSLGSLRYQYPQEYLPADKTATQHLRDLVEKGVAYRYPSNAENTPAFMEKVRRQVNTELVLIQKLQYEDYFLTLWEICEYATKLGILHQGRGSAANSVVCFTLGLTSIDPIRLGLLFERFMSEERGEPPDIDIDFEHARREEVIQYIYNKYGANHAAMVSTVICYRSRMAIRETAKVMGLPLEGIGRLVKFMGREGLSRLVEIAVEKGLNPPDSIPREHNFDSGSRVHLEDPKIPSKKNLPMRNENADLAQFGLDESKFQKLLLLAKAMHGFPRHLGIHSGGFVISRDPITDIVPVESATMEARYVIQWNKDDIDTLGLMKIDFLSLGMLTALKKSLEMMKTYKNIDWNLAQIPMDDAKTFAMIREADTIGVFQIESRAQMSMLPRLKPKTYYDLVIQVAIVRPGPIQGGMVHPYLKRRAGNEKVTYAHESLKPILEKTLGIPLFQEQVMQIAVIAAGFSPGEAGELRRVVASAWKRPAVMKGLRERLINGMLEKKIAREYAEQIYKTIEGFSAYGFPESHAASFALLTSASCYVKCHHPEIFTCSLLNSQPMGFYSPRQLISDAQRNDVQFQALDVQHSHWDYTLEKTVVRLGPKKTNSAGLTLQALSSSTEAATLAVRVGFRSVYGFREAHATILVKEREAHGPFKDLPELVRRSGLPRTVLVRLAAAGALTSFGLSPRETLWVLQGLSFDSQSLLFGQSQGLDEERSINEAAILPTPSPWEDVCREYQSKGFALETHPLAVLRPQLLKSNLRYTTAKGLETLRHRTRVRVAGLKSLIQKPPTAKGMCFVSIEDETGLMNIVITPDVYQQCRLLLQTTPLLEIEGQLESISGVRNVRAQKVGPLGPVF